jgi:hypothetical protein
MFVRILGMNVFLLIGIGFGFSQTPPANTPLSLQLHNVPLREALDHISQQTGLRVVFADHLVDGLRVSYDCASCSLEETLRAILKNTNLTYLIDSEAQIVLMDKEPASKRYGVVKGFVKDAANGETLPYVNVIIERTGFGDAADENGYYLIAKIPAGNYTIKATMLGYETQRQEIEIVAGKNLTLSFQLKPALIELSEVTVTAERERFERQIESSTIQLSPREIKTAPALLEADLFRALQMLPGVVSRTDFSSALYIRGGNPSENLILLDDVRIYNPYHLGGLFSTFNTDAIKSVDISVGGFPSRYGNAASSVISITNKDGNRKEFAAKGGISLMSTKLVLEQPLPKGSLLLSGRRTYFDYTFGRLMRLDDSRFPYYFYDFHGKVNFDLSPSSKLTLSGFYGDDVLHLIGSLKEVTNIHFGNRATTLKWQQLFNPRLFGEFILAASRFRTSVDAERADNLDVKLDVKDEIKDLTVKTDLTYFLSDRHEVKFGMDFQKLAFTLFLKVDDFTWLAYQGQKGRRANFYSAYVQDNWELSPRWNLQSGVRLTYYDTGNYFRLDPRLACRYRLKENLNLKASIGIYHQYFYTFNPEDLDYIRLVDLWFPIDERYAPIRAAHYIAGIEHWLSGAYTFSLEGYYKAYHHLLDLNEFGRDDVDIDDFLQGWGRAGGWELLLRKQRGKLTGGLGYSLAFTERTIETPRPSNQLTDNPLEKEYQTFPPGHDRRHALTFFLNYQRSQKWEFSTRLTYNSGLPETPVLGYRRCYNVDERYGPYWDNCLVKAKRNSKRLPSYFRWDASVTRNYKFKKWSLQAYLQIINLTNHHNLFFYDYGHLNDTAFDANGNYLGPDPKRQGIIMFPFLPTFGVNFEF